MNDGAATGSGLVGEEVFVLCRPGGDLLSHVLRQSTIGADAFDGRVRDGIGSGHVARATRPAKNEAKQQGVSDRWDYVVAARSAARPKRPAPADAGETFVPLFCGTNQPEQRPGGSPGATAPAAADAAVRSSPALWRGRHTDNGDGSDQAERAISTGQLHALLRFHIRPIDVVVFHGSSGRTSFEVGFPLRCLQRLSRPHIATLHCRWRDNSSTRGVFTPVLSY